VGDIWVFLIENEVLRETIENLKNRFLHCYQEKVILSCPECPETEEFQKTHKFFFWKNSSGVEVSCDKSVKI
jgi:hypothetical protein